MEPHPESHRLVGRGLVKSRTPDHTHAHHAMPFLFLHPCVLLFIVPSMAHQRGWQISRHTLACRVSVCTGARLYVCCPPVSYTELKEQWTRSCSKLLKLLIKKKKKPTQFQVGHGYAGVVHGSLLRRKRPSLSLGVCAVCCWAF